MHKESDDFPFEVDMKVATFIDENEEVVSLRKRGWMCLYEKVRGKWKPLKKIPLDLSRTETLAEARQLVEKATLPLEDCQVFLTGEANGLWNLLLEEAGFHTWKSQGTLQEQLDNVVRTETERNIDSDKTPAKAHSCGRGCGRGLSSDSEALPINEESFFTEEAGNKGGFKIDLASILERNPGLTSRQVLIPFMKRGAFNKLEVLCGHLPRWFNAQLECSGMTAFVENLSDDTLRVTVMPVGITKKAVS